MAINIIRQIEVINILDKAEIDLEKCYYFLKFFKHPALFDAKESLMEFQPMLAKCLHELMSFYQQLVKEERELVSNKLVMEASEFRICISANSKYKKAVIRLIEIGKSFGDAFSWFFYKDNMDELYKHLEHKKTGLYVSGIGGLGELEFICNNQNIDGLFVLYHGITSILRTGDFSLYSISKGIVGLGELKTEWNGDVLHISAHISSKIEIHSANESSKTSKTESNPMTQPFNAEKLKKQLIAQDEVFKKKMVDFNRGTQTEYTYVMLNNLASEKISYCLSSDKTLLIMGIREDSDKFSEILLSEEKLDQHFDSLPEEVKKTVVDGSNNNQIIYGNLDSTKLFQSRAPIFWWNIDENIIEKIMLSKLHVLTFFNPARLLDHYVSKGFVVVHNERKISLQRQIDSRVEEIQNMEMFFDLISHSFLTANSVISIIDDFISDLENNCSDSTTKTEIRIRLHSFGKPSEQENTAKLCGCETCESQ